MLPTASRLKSHLPKILLRHGRIFCLCPAHALHAIPHHRKEAGKRVLCSQVSWKATSPKILLRHGRIFCLCPAHALHAVPHHRKEAGKRVLCSQVSWKATSPKILLRHGRIFCLCPAHALHYCHRGKIANTRNANSQKEVITCHGGLLWFHLEHCTQTLQCMSCLRSSCQ